MADLVDRLAASLGPGPHADYNVFLAQARRRRAHGVKLTARRLSCSRPTWPNATRRRAGHQEIHKPGKAEADPLHGRYEVSRQVVEYEPTPTCATPSKSRCSNRAASRRSCAAKCCPTCRTPGMTRERQDRL